jgi:hypothetical protein
MRRARPLFQVVNTGGDVARASDLFSEYRVKNGYFDQVRRNPETEPSR